MNASPHFPTRRRAIAGIAVAVGSLATNLHSQAQQPAMEEKQSTGENFKKTSIRQEIDFKAPPQRIYEILLDGKQFAAVTGMSAEIDPKPGGTFKTFGGLIEGRNIELVPAHRIVQAWRPTSWDPGRYTLAHFELKPRAQETTIILDHTGFAEGDFDHFDEGWHLRYWNPLKKFLA